MADAGWYPDVQDMTLLRYFDGNSWTAYTRPVGAVPPMPQHQQVRPQQQAPQQQQQQSATRSYGAQPYAPQQPGLAPYDPNAAYAAMYGAPGPTAPRGRRNRRPVLIAIAAAAVVAAGVVTVVLTSRDDPEFTYRGKPVASPAKVLNRAEAEVDAVVERRHGRQRADSRCYFAQPEKARSGTRATDVDSALRCGPVLFVDGDAARQYLPVRMRRTSSKGDQVTLAPATSLAGVAPAAIGSGIKLARPDGKSAPGGDGGLRVPAPPAAAADALVAADLGATTPPTTLRNAVMGAKTETVTLLAAGEIPRYGTGDSARSAPPGKKLVAFRIKYSEGDVDSATTDRAQLTIAGSAPRPLPQLSDDDQWIVAALPSAGGAAVTLDSDRYRQSLSLPDGRPGAHNITVLARQHHSALIFKTFDVKVRGSEKGASAKLTLHGRIDLASLDFWIPGHTGQHAGDPRNAILSIEAGYTRKGSSQHFGFDPKLLKLKLPNGHVLRARNVADAKHVDDVFEVPGDFTRGTLQITGSEKQGKVTVRVSKTVSVGISVPAG